MKNKLKIGERFKRYANKFRKSIKVQPIQSKETLGEILTDEVAKAADQRLR